MYSRKIAFLGVGNMASAVIAANGGTNIDFSDIILFDRFPEKLVKFTEKGAYAAKTLNEAVSLADCIFLAVKPQDYIALMTDIRQIEGAQDKLYISIGAGIESKTVSDFIGCEKVVRALPNTPMLIGKGVSAVCRNADIPTEDYSFALSLFKSAGSVTEIDESEMNRIIGVTSSSPAYVFEFIKAIAEGAKEQGLDADNIIDSICDVVSGSALLLKSSKKTPDEMIAMVASKGGTTERALAVLAENDFSGTIKAAMSECTKRADELGKNK